MTEQTRNDEAAAGAEQAEQAVRARLDAMTFVLVETSHPGNIGAVARAMKSMGLHRLRLVAPKTFPAAEATARASGADDLLAAAQTFDTLHEAVADCSLVIGTSARARHLEWPPGTVRECAAHAVEASPAEVAFVFGREASGLTNLELDHCQRLMTIATNPHFRSLNLAAAAQVVAYELRQSALEAAQPAIESASGGRSHGSGEEGSADPLATSAEMEGFYEHLEEAMTAVGYLNPAAPKLLMRRMRRLFARSGLLKSELNILRGLCAAMTRKDEPPPP